MEFHLSDLAQKILAGLYEYRVTALAVFVALLRAYRDYVDQPATEPRKNYLYFLFGLLISIFTPRAGGGTGQLPGRVGKVEEAVGELARAMSRVEDLLRGKKPDGGIPFDPPAPTVPAQPPPPTLVPPLIPHLPDVNAPAGSAP